MKIAFNDATELTIQSASIRADGSLLIKTISATEEELRTMFQDEFKTKKMIVTERESTLGEYENYTDLNAVVKYTAGILGVVMYREKESPMDRIDALEEHVDNLTEANKSREAENAELIATVDSILTDVLPALLGDGTEENDTENTDTKYERKRKERMNDMTTFIARRIIEEADKSIEAGQKKYRAYFVKTRLYKRWKDNVDTILKTDGYDEVIVEN